MPNAAADIRIKYRPAVVCYCGHTVFDGEAIKARVVRVLPTGAEAKCKCKRWVSVPVTYSP